jgi:uncharacterized protein (TIGR02001 family)
MALKSKIAFALAGLCVTGAAFAQAAAEAPKAPEPDYTLSFNIGAISEYRYRGIAQTHFDGTLQGGADFAHKSGFYIGTWASGIKWIQDSGAKDGDVEWDIYGGYKTEIAKDTTLDIGYLRYQYINNSLDKVTGFVNANTDEVYAAISVGIFTAKYSYAFSDLFGNPNSKGSGYLDLSAAFDLGSGWSLTPHIGHQSVANSSSLDYTDYSLTLGKDFGNGWSVSAAAIGTDASKTLYVTPKGEFTGKSALVVGVKYTF